LKICCLVKEVPDAAVQKRIDPGTKRLDRSGERNLNPFDTHGIEAAMQLREGGDVEVDEIVAVTMGPDTAQRALHKAVALGADRSVHLTDDALSGSDVCATGYALAKVLEAESPDLVLLGQQSDDGECYTIGAVVADHDQRLELGAAHRLLELVAAGAELFTFLSFSAGLRFVCHHRSPAAPRAPTGASQAASASFSAFATASSMVPTI